MTRLPIVDAKTMERLLLKLGFQRTRQVGSHVIYQHSDGRRTVLPFHLKKDLPRPLTRGILREINLTIEQYIELLNQL